MLVTRVTGAPLARPLAGGTGSADSGGGGGITGKALAPLLNVHNHPSSMYLLGNLDSFKLSFLKVGLKF